MGLKSCHRCAYDLGMTPMRVHVVQTLVSEGMYTHWCQQALPEAQNAPWNWGELAGQKLPLKLRDVFGIRVRLQLQRSTRELALFNLAIDSKLRGCDLIALLVAACQGAGVAKSAGQSHSRRASECPLVKQCQLRRGKPTLSIRLPVGLKKSSSFKKPVQR
jgi:hypothetical protein